MFKIGDTVVYPSQGVATILRRTVQKIENNKQMFFEMKVKRTGLKILVPIKNIKNIGVRPLLKAKDIERVFSIISSSDIEDSKNWNKRYRENLAKIKSGDLFAIAEVFRDSYNRSILKDVSSGAKKLMTEAKELIITEIAEIKCVPYNYAKKLLEERINQSLDDLDKIDLSMLNEELGFTDDKQEEQRAKDISQEKELDKKIYESLDLDLD